MEREDKNPILRGIKIAGTLKTTPATKHSMSLIVESASALPSHFGNAVCDIQLLLSHFNQFRWLGTVSWKVDCLSKKIEKDQQVILFDHNADVTFQVAVTTVTNAIKQLLDQCDIRLVVTATFASYLA